MMMATMTGETCGGGFVVMMPVCRYKDHGGEVWDDYDEDEYFDGESGAARRGMSLMTFFI
jgi:hypothetical protein